MTGTMRLYPAVSVIIPAYNCADKIGACLTSLAVQTVLPDEIIVVDDGSVDETVAVVESFCELPIRLLLQGSNKGAQVARNRGIREARNSWIAFQDADDEWLPEKLEMQLDVLCNNNNDEMTMIHTDGIWCGNAYNDELPVQPSLVDGSTALITLLRGPGPLFPSILVSRQALVKIGFLDEILPSYQEWDTAIRLAKICRVTHIREPLVRYNRQQRSISSNGRQDLVGYQYVMEKHASLIQDLSGHDLWDRHLRSQAVRAMAFGLWDEATQFLKWNGFCDWRYFVLWVLIGLQISPNRLMRTAAYLRNLSAGKV